LLFLLLHSDYIGTTTVHTDGQSLLKEVNNTIHSTFFHSTFCPILHYLYSISCPIRCYFYSTFCPIRHYVPFGLYYFRYFVRSTFCPILHFVRSTFCIIRHFVNRHFVPFDVLSFDVLYFRRLLLRHFVGEPYLIKKSSRLLSFYHCRNRFSSSFPLHYRLFSIFKSNKSHILPRLSSLLIIGVYLRKLNKTWKGVVHLMVGKSGGVCERRPEEKTRSITRLKRDTVLEWRVGGGAENNLSA
jgi:hypothetical protein